MAQLPGNWVKFSSDATMFFTYEVDRDIDLS